MNIGNIIEKTFTNQAIIDSIVSTVSIILLGFFLRKKNILLKSLARCCQKLF